MEQIEKNSHNQIYLAALIVVVVIVGGFLLLVKDTNAPGTDAEKEATTTNTTVVNKVPDNKTSVKNDTAKPVTKSTASGQVNTLGAQPVVLVNYTDTGFSPFSLEIKKEQTLRFNNQSTSGMWISSNPHPTHTDYPGFDQKKVVFRGEYYEFTFTKVGTWGYHNHINPNQTGKIIVK